MPNKLDINDWLLTEKQLNVYMVRCLNCDSAIVVDEPCLTSANEEAYAHLGSVHHLVAESEPWIDERTPRERELMTKMGLGGTAQDSAHVPSGWV